MSTSARLLLVHNRRVPHHNHHRRLFRRATMLIEHIAAYSDAHCVRDVQQLQLLVNEFLAIPANVLQEWEERYLGAQP